LEALDVEALRETLGRLRLEIAELRASRERLVRAADADRRRTERALHDGVHQHLIGLAVEVQLARALIDTDPAEAKTRLDQMGRDVQHALEDTVRLAQRIYPPLLEGGGLGAALRAAATSGGTPASIDAHVAGSHPLEVVATVYLCCIEALEGAGTDATVTVREEDGALSFTVGSACAWQDADLNRVRDRVEALGGLMTIESEGGGTRVSGSLPLAR
jgi:signal transduction histidine kinase